MCADLLTSFSSAAIQTFKLLLDLDGSLDATKSAASNVENKDNIDISIEITGDLSGEITYFFPKDTSLEMVKMMCGMEFNEIDEFIKSSLGEISNIISGNALTDLSEQKVICDILPPKILDSKSTLPSNEEYTIYHTKVKTAVGDVELKLRTK